MVKFILAKQEMLLSMTLLFISSIHIIDSRRHYINNGTEASIYEFPFQVGLSVSDSFCGGSLISNTFILTAAHCIDPFDVEEIIAYLGSATIYQGIPMEAIFTIVHEEFNPESLKNDIGIVEIEHIDYTNIIRNIALPEISDSYPDYESENVATSGWGRNNRWPSTSNTLQYVEVIVISNEECAALYKPGTVTDTNICIFGKYGRSPCPGDSGGPLMHMDSKILIGITSFGPKRNCTYGAAFTRVTEYRQWIEDNTGI